ncbi:unnamed protein product [Anisakis simplex]|uniref:Trehalase n=1 Tax=Anisakis simplex TaxID=6269 RepID=A0A3P6NKD3_ANISI|nr:unnamed protein product [Anisakis simplex]
MLEAVNRHSIYADSKTFVDMPMRFSPQNTHREFIRRFGNESVDEIDARKLRKFLLEHFTEPGSELETCEPSDWHHEPIKLIRINDVDLRNWAMRLNEMWLQLCRKMKKEVDGDDRHSLIYVPNEFIVPGGRFREYYYWDTYWTVKGLVASGMLNTVKSMIRNFESIVDRYGFIPNGGRVYYLGRSQPPMFIPIVYEYFEQTKDVQFLKSILPALLKEFRFWNENRLANVTGQDGRTHQVYQYRSETNVPRPESFREDFNNAAKLPPSQRSKFYQVHKN